MSSALSTQVKISKAYSPLKIGGSKGDYRQQVYDMLIAFRVGHQAKSIVEPFVGGHNMAPVYDRYREHYADPLSIIPITISDVNHYIGDIWREIKHNPLTVAEFYMHQWNLMSMNGKSHFYRLRDAFNEYHHPIALLTLQRWGFGGKMSFDKHGKYATTVANSRVGLTPDKLWKSVHQWSDYLKNTSILTADYAELPHSLFTDAIVFLDPPYARVWNKTYTGKPFDMAAYYDWVVSLKDSWVISAVPTHDITEYGAKAGLEYQIYELTHGKDRMNSGKGGFEKDNVHLFLSGRFTQ